MSLSKTCLYVAAGRALGAREPDAAVRNPDYLAERLLGPEERAMVADEAVMTALDQDYAEALKNPEAANSTMMMLIRTRFIDERLEHAIRNGASQVVILGAGFDTRAYRLTELLRDAQVYEVDQPSTQEHKKRRVRESGIDVPANLHYVAVNFKSDNLGQVLARSGYDASKKTFFICEGVTMYLPEEAVEEMFRWVAAQAAGSAVVFDSVYRNVITFLNTTVLDNLPDAAKQAVARVRRLESGEPWIFGIPDDGEREFLLRLGLEMTEVLAIGGEESRARYLIRSDGSPFIPALAGWTTAQAARRSPYMLAEAVVKGG